MSNKYNQYYKHQKPEETTEQELDTTSQVVENEQELDTTNQVVDNEQQNDDVSSENAQQSEDTTPDAPAELIEGHVTNCLKLNIRKEPNIKAAILCEVALNSVLAIDPAKSNEEWLSVVTDVGVNGFCMAKYVNITQ